MQVAVANLIGGQFGALQWFPWQHEVVVSLLLKAADTTLAPMYIDSNRVSVYVCVPFFHSLSSPPTVSRTL